MNIKDYLFYRATPIYSYMRRTWTARCMLWRHACRRSVRHSNGTWLLALPTKFDNDTQIDHGKQQ